MSYPTENPNFPNTIIVNQSYLLTADFQIYLCDATNGSFTLTLPSIQWDGIQCSFTRIDSASSNSVTINDNNNNTLYTMTPGQILNLVTYSLNWYNVSF